MTEKAATVVFPRDSRGLLDSFAWPGGYPLFYLTRDGGTLCPQCANRENGSIAHTGCANISQCAEHDAQWCIVASDVHWEGEAIECDHCGNVVESAYGHETPREES